MPRDDCCSSCPPVFGVTVVVFLLARAVPGDPAQLAAGEQATPEMVEVFRREYRLDRPLYVQYATYISGMVPGRLRALHVHRPSGAR